MRYMLPFCALLLLASVGGVFATWYFAENPADAATETASLIMNENQFSFSDASKAEAKLNTKLAENLSEILNEETQYDQLTQAMDDNYQQGIGWTASFVGNATQSGSQQLLSDLFQGALSAQIDDEDVKITCIIKRENIDGNDATGDSYTVDGITYSGCEMTLYVTTSDVDNLAFNTKIPVYAMVFTRYSSDGEWVQIGSSVYEGTAAIVGYFGGTTNGSFNTGEWRSSASYHGLSSGATIGALIKKWLTT